MSYQLWNLQTGNMIGDFDSEAEALAFIRETVELDGEAAASNWGLAETSPDGKTSTNIGEGAALLARALNTPIAKGTL
jgi:hypothetical protein